MRLPRLRFTLVTAMFAVAGVANLLAIALVCKRAFAPSHSVISLTLGAIDGDAETLAREIVSPAVIDEVILRPRFRGHDLDALPSFGSGTDQREELRRLLSVEPSPSTMTLRISMPFSRTHKEGIILEVVATACVKILGPGRVAVLGEREVESTRTPYYDTMIICVLPWVWFNLLNILYWKRRASAKAASLG
jgi:hypothetical protein